MVATRNPIKKYEEFGVEKGLIKPVKIAGNTGGASIVPTAENVEKQIFTLANLRALGAINAADDVPDYIDVYIEEEVSSVEVDPSLLEEAEAVERAPKDSWIRMIPAKEVDQMYGSEVKPFGFFDSEDTRIDLDAVIAPLDTENAFFGEDGLAPITKKEDSYFGKFADRFFADEGKSLASAKVRGATARNTSSLESAVEQSAPFKSMSNKNIGQYDVASMQKNILYDFVERNIGDLSKASGVKGFFKKRKLKKQLHDLTKTACLWHLNDQNDRRMQNDYSAIKSGVLEALDTIVSSKDLRSAYKTENGVAAAKEAVDIALMKYASPLAVAGTDRSVFDGIGQKYAQQTVEEKVTEPVRPSTEEASAYVQSPARRFFTKAAAVAGLVASVFAMGAPVANQYAPATIEDDSNIAVADQADDRFVSYAIDAIEFPNAEDPAPAPAPEPRRSRRAAPAQEVSPSSYAPDAHINPRAYDVGGINLANQNVVVDDGEMAESPAPLFRTREGARLAALSMGTPEYNLDDSRLSLAPVGEGHDYTKGGSDFTPWTEYK